MRQAFQTALPAIFLVGCATTTWVVEPSWVQLDRDRLSNLKTIAVVIGRDEPCYALLRPKYGEDFSISSRPAGAASTIEESRVRIDNINLAQALVGALESLSKFHVKSIREVSKVLQSVEIDLPPSDESWGNLLTQETATKLQKLDVDVVCVAWTPISSWATGDYLLVKLFSMPDGTALGSYKTLRQPVEQSLNIGSESYYFSQYDPAESARSMANEAIAALLEQVEPLRRGSR